ncbi:hypothetical protein HT031_006851 [Scenedesmus sp. PABB004]|nr:hypothetical protein HT031_006851 [Scenedesmus sp. PABB004]
MTSSAYAAALAALDAGGGAGSAGGDEQAPLLPAWGEQRALLLRLRSFGPATWFGKPPPLAPSACAARGWRNAAPDTLACDACGGQVLCLLPPNPLSPAGEGVVRGFVRQLTEGHAPGCPARAGAEAAAAATAAGGGPAAAGGAGSAAPPTPAAAAPRFPGVPPARLRTSYQARVAQLARLDAPPRVAATAAQRLAAAAAALDAALLPALATLLALPVAVLRGDVAAAVPPPAALTAQQAAALLALCGWRVRPLLPPHLAAAAAPPGGAFAVSHLLPAPRRSASAAPPPADDGSGPLSSATAALECELCGSAVGLWQAAACGPYYAAAQASKAAQLLRGAAAAAGQGGGGGGGDAPAAPTPDGALGGEQAQPSSYLSATIAGGSLLAAAGSGGTRTSASPAPFGVAAAAPAFGGGGGGGGGGDLFGLASPPPVAAANGASGGPFGAPCGGSSPPPPVFGLGALRDEEARTKRRRSGSASAGPGPAATRGDGSAASPAPSGAGGVAEPAANRLSSSGAGLARQPSAGAGGAPLGSRCLDPVAQHRAWCPWVHVPPGVGGLGAVLAVGWASTLLALHEEHQHAASAAGGPADDVRCAASAPLPAPGHPALPRRAAFDRARLDIAVGGAAAPFAERWAASGPSRPPGERGAAPAAAACADPHHRRLGHAHCARGRQPAATTQQRTRGARAAAMWLGRRRVRVAGDEQGLLLELSPPERRCCCPPRWRRGGAPCSELRYVPFAEVVSLRWPAPARDLRCALELSVLQRAPRRPWLWGLATLALSGDAPEVEALAARVRCALAAAPGRPRRLLVLINPIGGRRAAQRTWDTVAAPVLAAAGVQCEVVRTTHQGHAEAVVRGLALERLAELDGVVGVGGDGLFSELLAGLLQHPHPAQALRLRLALIPGGSTDAVACTCAHATRTRGRRQCAGAAGLPRPPADPRRRPRPIHARLHGTRDALTATLHIALGDSTPLDVAQVVPLAVAPPVGADVAERGATAAARVLPSVCVASWGFLGDVLQMSSTLRWMGPARYDVAGLLRFLGLRSREAAIWFKPPPDDGGGGGAARRLADAATAQDAGHFDVDSWLPPAAPLPGGDTPAPCPPSPVASGSSGGCSSGGSPEPYAEVTLAVGGPHKAAAAVVAASSVSNSLGGSSSAAAAAAVVAAQRGGSVANSFSSSAVCSSGCALCGAPQQRLQRSASRASFVEEAQRGAGGTHAQVAGAGVAATGAPGPGWRRLAAGSYTAVLVAVSSCRSEKSSAGVSPDGHLADGRLALIAVRRCGRLAFLRFLLALARRGLPAAGDATLPPFCEVHRAVAVELHQARGAAPWNIDGELLVGANAVRIAVRPGLVDVFARGVEPRAG